MAGQGGRKHEMQKCHVERSETSLHQDCNEMFQCERSFAGAQDDSVAVRVTGWRVDVHGG